MPVTPRQMQILENFCGVVQKWNFRVIDLIQVRQQEKDPKIQTKINKRIDEIVEHLEKLRTIVSKDMPENWTIPAYEIPQVPQLPLITEEE